MYNIEFPALEFDKPGVYSYTVKEHSGHDANWITDERVYQVIIIVTESDGKLSADIEYPDGFPVFINYKKRHCYCCCICVCCCCCCCKKKG